MHHSQIHTREVPIHRTLQIGRSHHVLHRIGTALAKCWEMFPYIGLQACGAVLWVEQVGLMGEFGVLMRLLIGESTQRVGCTADPATTRASDVEPFYGLRQVASSKVGMGARQDDFTVWRGDPVESEVETVFVTGHQMDDLAGRVGGQMKVDAAI